MKIEFNEQQLQVLNAALGEIPFKLAAPLVAHINAQIQRHFDAAKGDDPTGQTKPKDEFLGD
jgi:hypothetical protein